jgi:putative transposase
MSIVKLDINAKIIFEDKEYVIKGYPALDEVLGKQTVAPFSEKIFKVNDIIKEVKNSKLFSKTLVETSEKDFIKAEERFKIIEPLLEIKNRTADDVKKIAKKHKKGLATIIDGLVPTKSMVPQVR